MKYGQEILLSISKQLQRIRMKFSIIMASYNQVDFIDQAIQSVLMQTYQNFELIIVDGMSNDGSRDMINRYKEYPNVKILIEKDKGLYHARNKGLLLATGDIISFLNTDDYYQEDALEQLLIHFKEHPKIDAFYGVINFIDKEGSFIKKYGDFEYDKLKQIREYIPLPDQSTFIRRKHLSYIGVYDSTFSIIGDWDFWVRAMVLDLNFKNIEIHIANYRDYDEALTSNPKFERIRFQEIRRLYRKYNDVCISSFIIRLYKWYYIVRPLKKVTFLSYLYTKYYKKIVVR